MPKQEVMSNFDKQTEAKIAWHYQQVGRLMDEYTNSRNNIFLYKNIQAHLEAVRKIKKQKLVNMKAMSVVTNGKSMTTQQPRTTRTNYQAVETNIYKTGNRYRVRVGDFSEYEINLKSARKTRTRLKKAYFADPLI